MKAAGKMGFPKGQQQSLSKKTPPKIPWNKTRPPYQRKPTVKTRYDKFEPKPWDTRPTKSKIKPFYNANQQQPKNKYAQASSGYHYPKILKYKDLKPKKLAHTNTPTNPRYQHIFNQTPKTKLNLSPKINTPDSQLKVPQNNQKNVYPLPEESNPLYNAPPTKIMSLGRSQTFNKGAERPLTPLMFPKNNRWTPNDLKSLKQKIKDALNNKDPQRPQYKQEGNDDGDDDDDENYDDEENLPNKNKSPSLIENIVLPKKAPLRLPQINPPSVFNPIGQVNPFMKKIQKQIDDTAKQIQDSLGNAFPFNNMMKNIVPFQNMIPKVSSQGNMLQFSGKPVDSFNPRHRNRNIIEPSRNQISSTKQPSKSDEIAPWRTNPRFLHPERRKLSDPIGSPLNPAAEGRQQGQIPGGSSIGIDEPWAINPRYKQSGMRGVQVPRTQKTEAPRKQQSSFTPNRRTPDSPWFNPRHKQGGMRQLSVSRPERPTNQQDLTPESRPFPPGGTSTSDSRWLYNPRYKPGGMRRLPTTTLEQPEKQQASSPLTRKDGSDSPWASNPRHRPGGMRRLPVSRSQTTNKQQSSRPPSGGDSSDLPWANSLRFNVPHTRQYPPRKTVTITKKVRPSTQIFEETMPDNNIPSPNPTNWLQKPRTPDSKAPSTFPKQKVKQNRPIPNKPKRPLHKNITPEPELKEQVYELPDRPNELPTFSNIKIHNEIRTNPTRRTQNYYRPPTQHLRYPQNIQRQPPTYPGKQFRQPFENSPQMENNWLPNTAVYNPRKMDNSQEWPDDDNDLKPITKVWSVKTPTGKKTTIRKTLKGTMKGGPLQAHEMSTFSENALPGGQETSHESSRHSNWSSGDDDPLSKSGSSSSSSFSSSSSSSSSSNSSF